MTVERDHDLRLCELFRDLDKVEKVLASRLNTLRHISRPAGVRFDREDRRTTDQIVADVRAMDPNVRIVMYRGNSTFFLDEYETARKDVQQAHFDIAHHDAAYTGWQRYYLVTSSAGLVHASTSCHTCNKGRNATTFALVADFSGLPFHQLVEAVGPLLCSVCFPEAPVAWQEQDRIPARVAEVLFTRGYEAFKAEWTKFQDKRAARARK